MFCALTFKPVAFGFLKHRIILKILHSPLCGIVLVSVSDGTIYAFHDNISRYNTLVPQNDVIGFFHNVDRTTVIRKLERENRFTSNLKTHCMTGVALHPPKNSFESEGDKNGKLLDEGTPLPGSKEPTVEIWCGQDKGRILILDANTLRVIHTLNVFAVDPLKDSNEAFNVQFIETTRSFQSVVNNKPSDSPSQTDPFVWLVVYPGTKVSRWNVRKRCLDCSLDVTQHPPWHDCEFLNTQ